MIIEEVYPGGFITVRFKYLQFEYYGNKGRKLKRVIKKVAVKYGLKDIFSYDYSKRTYFLFNEIMLITECSQEINPVLSMRMKEERERFERLLKAHKINNSPGEEFVPHRYIPV